MKKTILFIFLIFSLNSFAQDDSRSFRFGLKATPTIGWMKPDFRSLPQGYSVDGGGLRIGFLWGPTAEVEMNETFLISTGLDISYTSAKLSGKVNADTFRYDWNQVYNLRFVDIPLMLKFRTKEIGYMRYFGLFGFSAGFRASAKADFSIIENGSTITTPNDVSSKYVNLFRSSLLVGAGVEYNISGNTSLVGSIVFNNGFTNMLKDKKAGENPSIRNSNLDLKEKGLYNYFMLNMGILF